jgi:hypothetical protein
MNSTSLPYASPLRVCVNVQLIFAEEYKLEAFPYAIFFILPLLSSLYVKIISAPCYQTEAGSVL